MAAQRFPIRLGRRSAAILWPWGVKAGLAYAELEDSAGGLLRVRFGRVRFETPLSNVASWRIEGPFIWIRAIGVRRSLRGGDVSFAGAAHGGVRLDFRAAVRWSLFHVPAVYVGADDLDAFAAALRERGIEGEDARRR